MSTAKLSAVAAIIITSVSGCATPSSYHLTRRGIVSVTGGGSQEAWIVMEEVGTDLNNHSATLRRNVYAVYHCIPTGCKRIGELDGTKLYKRAGGES